MKDATPEQVQAALDEGRAFLVGLFCDNDCTSTIERGVIAENQQRAFAALRDIAAEEGWSVIPHATGDYCPECVKKARRAWRDVNYTRLFSHDDDVAEGAEAEFNQIFGPPRG